MIMILIPQQQHNKPTTNFILLWSDRNKSDFCCALVGVLIWVCVNYWRDQRAAARIDYDGPVTQKWGIPRLGNAPLPFDAS